MKTYILTGVSSLQILFHTLFAVFFSVFTLAKTTTPNDVSRVVPEVRNTVDFIGHEPTMSELEPVDPPNAYHIDHRGIPQFDENDVVLRTSYSELQAAGLSSTHLQTHSEGDDEFVWEIPTDDISAEDYALIGGPPGFPAVVFAGFVYAFENQYYFVPRDEGKSDDNPFPADAYNPDTGDFHFLPSVQAVANRIENNRAMIGRAFHNSPDTSQPIIYTLPNLNVPTLDYGDTVTLENDFVDVIELQLSDGGTGDITLTGNGNLSSVLDLGSVITSHEQITIDAATGSASITLPDANTSTFSFSDQRWLSYTITDINGDPWQVGVYIGSGNDDFVLGDEIFRTSTALADIREIVFYGLDGKDNVSFSFEFVQSVVVGELFGGSDDDTMQGIEGSSSIIIYGEEGEDFLQGESNDIVFGGPGDDTFVTRSGVTNSTVFGGGDDDSIFSGTGGGDDRLYGGPGIDKIFSYGGHDVIYGGTGNDDLHAGEGVDIFVFDGSGDGSDRIGDLAVDLDDEHDIFEGQDKLYFINTSLTSRDELTLSSVTLNGEEVVSIQYTEDAEDIVEFAAIIGVEESSHLIRRSNIVFEDANGNVVVNVDEGETGAVYWPVVTDENFDYSAISHSISGSGADNGLFSIDTSNGGISFNDMPRPQDANGDEVYEVSIVISDGTTDLPKSLAIHINESEPPTFDSTATADPIDENSGANQVVYTIEATDNVAVVRYGIGNDDVDTFDVDPDSGEVTLLENPDYESASSYSFEVRAFDAQENVAFMTVTLAINDLNDNAPVFSSGSAVSVAEGQTATGYTASATDADTGSTISYSITGGVDHTLFMLTDGALSFKSAPDFETPGDGDVNNDYEVIITATDGTHGTTRTVRVRVTDLNDNAPVFSSGSTVSIAEGQTATGYTASATDADAGSTISYSITGGVDHNLFMLTDGVLSFKSAPDFEIPGDDNDSNDYEVIITATDGTHGTTQTVTVIVTDIDEVAPTITTTLVVTAIDENATGSLGSVSADESVTWSITGTGVSIDETGAITLDTAVDYESQTTISFTVTAEDAAGNTATSSLIVNVNDLDEVAPTITTTLVVTAIDENATGSLGSVSADESVTWSITGTGVSIDETGAITLDTAVDYESQTTISFTVTAEDTAGNTATSSLIVNVNDLDEVAPQLLDTPEGNHSQEGVVTISIDLSEEVSLLGESIADDFTIIGAASNPVVSSISVSGSELTLTLSGAVAQGEMVELSYTKSENAGSIVDGSGNRLEDFSEVEVNFVTFNLNKSKEAEIFFTNPVRDYLEIRSESVVKGIALYSLTGQRVFERKPNVTALSLDISSLAQGIYLMKVKTTTHQTTLKLVKQ